MPRKYVFRYSLPVASQSKYSSELPVISPRRVDF